MAAEIEQKEQMEMTAASMAVAQSAPEAQADAPGEAQPVAPVRSAKDAINAMYAQDSNKRLSTYLAASAKEIINASSRPAGSPKSAANLHRGKISHQIESIQPSAAGIIKSSKTERIVVTDDASDAMDPLARKATAAPKRRVVKTTTASPTVVKTSLKLDPRRKAALKVPPRSVRTPTTPTVHRSMSTRKGTTTLEQLLAGQDVVAPTIPTEKITNSQSVAPQNVKPQATRPQMVAKPTVKRPRTRAPQGLVQDIMRPAPAVNPAQAIQNAAAQTVAATKASCGPLDSIKRRFKVAPKGFAKTAPETQATSYAGFAAETPEAAQTATPPKAPVEIYGLMDDEPTGKSADGLGVIEDYKGGLTEQKVAQGSGTGANAAPNNNKYSIKGQSPLFLKSVNVEKRPLSEGPARRKDTVGDGTLYAQPSTEALGAKNIYEAQPKESKKATVPAKPTVIIPASRRSKAPLICLLILTVILGAAVGAFIYLCFFQYME